MLELTTIHNTHCSYRFWEQVKNPIREIDGKNSLK